MLSWRGYSALLLLAVGLLGLYFGAESGEVFGSVDGGGTWTVAAEHLPPVTSVRPGA